VPFIVLSAARSSRRPVVGLFAVGAALALVACGSSATTPSPVDVTVGPSISPDKSAPPAPVIPPTWPLTGVAAAVVNRPALVVKIENSPEARPQTGLDQTDMVFEEVVEGGITRFAAVFNSVVPDKVGPVRSVRPMDAGITAPLHGLIAFSGGIASFVNAIKAAGAQIISMDLGSKGFARSKDRPAPHNVYGTPSTFWSQADANHSAPPPAQFSFAKGAATATAAVAGTPLTTLSLRLSPSSSPVWTWSAASGVFARAEGAKPAVTAAGNQLTATNVVVLRVRMANTGATDPAGNPVPETVMVDSGDALVVSGGKQVAAKWSKASTADPIVLTSAADGSAIKLAPGNTWIELVPTSTGSVAAS
jgi:hypothetical protein